MKNKTVTAPALVAIMAIPIMSEIDMPRANRQIMAKTPEAGTGE